MSTSAEDTVEWMLAPLAGYTDVPFRRGCRRCGCRFAFTPLIDGCALVHGNRHNREILARGEDEEWLGVQVLGSDPEVLERAAALLYTMPFERVDINMGCPVRKVTRRGAGAALPLTPDLALRCVDAVRRQCPDRALSVKLRILAEEDAGPTVAFARRLENAGVCALTIHGRTWQRVYAGPVAAATIRAVREAVRIPVTANGGVFSREDGLRLAAITGCKAVMVARGAIGNPWIFNELRDATATPPSHAQVCEVLREHIEGMLSLYGEGAGLREGRKIILAYLCGRGYPRPLRASVSSVSTLAEFDELYRQICATAAPESPTPYRQRAALTVAE
jgi:tRNA-dihydrouridine synthase B